MRNPERLDDFYKEIHYLHKTYAPDSRFTQLMEDLSEWYQEDMFYLEEDEFLKILKEFLIW